MREKLNKLALLLPEGCIASIPWLKTRGYSAQLIERYKKSGRLVQLGRSAYRRLGRLPEWQDVVSSLDQCWNLPVHAGAVTALELQGLGHYVRLGKNTRIYIYIQGSKMLPQWVHTIETGASFVTAKTSLFKPPHDREGLVELECPKSPWSMRVSAPERAILEMLDLVPGDESFEHASLITEGLLSLRPDVLMTLLGACTRIKVKRLFLFLAEHFNLPCFSHLDVNRIDLGKGTRQIVKNGRYDAKYRITIPKSLQ